MRINETVRVKNVFIGVGLIINVSNLARLIPHKSQPICWYQFNLMRIKLWPLFGINICKKLIKQLKIRKENEMKTKKILITVLALAIVTFASAADLSKMMVNPLNAKQLIVSVVNDGVANFEISVFARNGDMVYFKQSDKPILSYQKIFDVQNLENGKYKMIFKVDNSSIEKDFTVTTNKIFLGVSELTIDPYFVFDGKDLKLSYLNFNKEKFNLEIYNEKELIFKTKIGDDFPIHSGYNLSKLEAGNYKAVLSSYDKEFSYQFVK
jgi:hypothetical protein